MWGWRRGTRAKKKKKREDQRQIACLPSIPGFPAPKTVGDVYPSFRHGGALLVLSAVVLIQHGSKMRDLGFFFLFFSWHLCLESQVSGSPSVLSAQWRVDGRVS